MSVLEKVFRRDASSAKQSLEPSFLTADEVDAEIPADADLLEPVRDLENVAQLPSYETLLTGPKGEFALGDEGQRASLAALRMSATTAAILVIRRELQSNEYLSLLQAVRRKFANVTTIVVRSSLLLALYEGESSGARRRAERQEGEESLSSSLFRDMVERGIALKSSDLHVCTRIEDGTTALLYRIHGKLIKVDSLPSQKGLQAVMYAYTKMADPNTRSEGTFYISKFQSCTIPYTAENGRSYRLRWQSFPCTGGQDVVFRILDNELSSDVRTLEDLGYAPSQCYELGLVARKTSGLVMVAGRTNSGKSTTLLTMSTLSPTRRYRKAYEVSDPIEYRRSLTTQINVQRSADDFSEQGNPFVPAMRAVLRGDPDDLTIGEIRDQESGSMVKTMVQSGHKVSATTHCDSGIEIVERLASPEIGIPRNVLGSRKFLAALMYQHLVPVLCECKLPARGHLPASTVDQLERKFGLSVGTMFVTNPDGCPKCNGSGTSSLTVIAEVMIPDRTMLQCFRDGKDAEAEEHWRTKRRAGFDDPDMTGKTCMEHGLYKVHRGLVDPIALEDEFEPFELYQVQPLLTEGK